MMASIPNMRSTPLPLPARNGAAAGAPAGEAAPDDFAARLPVPSDQPGAGPKPRPQVAQPPAEGEPSEGIPPRDGTKAVAHKGDALTEETAAALPFLQTQPPPPAPQVLPAVAAEETAPPVPAETQTQAVQAAPVGRRACGTGSDGGKPGLPVPAFVDVPKGEAAPAPETAAAVKALLQRKLLAAGTGDVDTTVRTRPTSADTAEAAAPQPQPATAVQVQLPAAELPQPVLAALDARPATAEGGAETPRPTELPTPRRLDLTADGEWLDRLARDIAQAGSRDTPLRFRLHPQTLGHLHVELQQGDHGTAVRLTVETEAARQLLADASPRLAAEARAQGVRIAETHVDLTGSGREAPGDRRRQDEARQTPLIRTALGAGPDALAAPGRPRANARPDRYA